MEPAGHSGTPDRSRISPSETPVRRQEPAAGSKPERDDGLDHEIEVLLRTRPADMPTTKGRSKPIKARNPSRSPRRKTSRSIPVGITAIGVFTPRSLRILSVLALGAMTWSHRFTYPVESSTTNRRTAAASART
jgi:hypothetical protein